VDMTQAARLPHQPCTPVRVEAAPLLPENLWMAPSNSPSYAAVASSAQQPHLLLAACYNRPNSREGKTNPSRMAPLDQEASRHLPVAKDPQTQHPLTHEEASPIIRLPSSSLIMLGPEEATLVPFSCAGPITRTCRSFP
jgi:hypothetical protein